MCKNAIKVSIDSIFAGVMIAIGSVVYLNCPNRIVGAFLFSVGLITILSFKFLLYTGIVGGLRSVDQMPYTLHVFIMNGVGCSLASLVPTNGASELVASKLSCPMHYTFVRAIICGILIFICVCHRDDIRITLLAVPSFILCGAEHSIADICFMFAAKSFSWRGVLFILVVATGNAIGAIAMSMWICNREKYGNARKEHNELH